jgi:hypothetical protein
MGQLQFNAINCTDGPTIDDVRLSIDAISLNVDLPSISIAHIEQFVHEISDGTPKYKTSFHRFKDRFYMTGFRAYMNDQLAWEPTGASAFVCQTGSKPPVPM